MANGIITYGEIAEHLPMLVVECSTCGRRGQYHTVELVAKHGAGSSIAPFQSDVTRDCPKRNGVRAGVLFRPHKRS